MNEVHGESDGDSFIDVIIDHIAANVAFDANQPQIG